MKTLFGTSSLQDINAMIPYAQLVGLDISSDEQGLLTILRAHDDNIGNEIIGAVHGGVVAGLMEHAASFHLLDELVNPVRIPRIINVSIDYLRPALNKNTFARGQVVKQGKRVANVRVTAWQDDESRPVAAAHAHFLIA
ncbi:PaaI family thioesterase [Terasakiella sp.]|uniref:PaaI family thioesterase n=1 Tax=Terasakiella sp. TaxID=2034861 RepID=UPI003AA98D2A